VPNESRFSAGIDFDLPPPAVVHGRKIRRRRPAMVQILPILFAVIVALTKC
jgi:CheY-specific phosphatase CheX